MITPDRLLIAWWILAAVTIVPSIVLTWWVDRADRRAAVLSYLAGNFTGRYRFRSVDDLLPRFIAYARLLALIPLFVGIFVFFWMGNWTSLLRFNFYILLGAFAAGMAAMAFSPDFLGQSSWTPGRYANGLVRVMVVLLGVSGVAISAWALFGDFCRPRLVVEGRVERLVTSDWDWLSDIPSYAIVISGRRFDTTREVVLQVKSGDRIRAKIGAFSNTVFEVEPVAR